MKFALPFLFSAVALGALACFLAESNPVELPPGMAEKHKTPAVVSFR